MVYLSYTGFKTKRDCDFKYWLQYVRDARYVVIDIPLDNCANSLFGSTVGTVFEHLYNDEIWRKKSGTEQALLDLVEPTYEAVVKDNLKPDRWTGEVTRCLKWSDEDEGSNYASKEELLEDAREAVSRGLRSVRSYRLIGLYAKAEVKLDVTRGEDILSGRVDFLMDRMKPHSDRLILDGKGTKNPQWVDPDQLRWYGMLHLERYKVAPDKMGFLLWRFEPMNSIDWLSYSKSDLLDMRSKSLSTLDNIRSLTAKAGRRASVDTARKVFRPRPSDDACRFCKFAIDDVCPKGAVIAEGLRKRSADRKKRRR